MPGCRRSPSFNTGPRWTPRCAGISAASLPHAVRSTAHHGSTPNCAGKDGGIHAGALRPWSGRGVPPPPGARQPVPRTTNSRHNHPIAPNRLERNFTAERPDQVWLADISYIATDEGWLYLAAIKDMATREIVGWSMADHLRTGLCTDALVMACSVIPQHRV